MKIYRVLIKKSTNDIITKKIFAPNIEKALKDAQRYIKKNYYSSSEVLLIEYESNIDIFYRS